MNEYVIRAENLGKKYTIINSENKKRKLLRDLLQDSLSKSVHFLGSKVGLSQRGEDTQSGRIIFWALENISFTIHAGESVGIIGSNGAGKSTLLKIISRITSPTTGKVRIRGHVGSLLEVGTGFHPDLTGRENVYLNGSILGMRRQEINKKFDEIIAFSEVEKFLDTQVKHYSSGMKMRLAFSVAAHLDPEILLIDEVLAVGDAAFQRKSLKKMGSVVGDGRTVLFVSHNMAALRAFCHKAIYIENGRIQTIGPVDDVINIYLHSKGNQESENKISGLNLNKPAQILSAEVLDQTRKPSTSLPHDKPFYIRLKIAFHKPLPQTFVTLKIYTQELDMILATHDFEQNESKLVMRSPGIYTVDVNIPAPLLSPGQYLLGLSITRIKRERQTTIQEVDHTTPFEIYDNGSILARSNTPWKGMVHTPITWEDICPEE